MRGGGGDQQRDREQHHADDELESRHATVPLRSKAHGAGMFAKV